MIPFFILKYLCIYPATQHSWRYDRKINGTLSILVKLNREFGKVTKYLLSWADLDFADLSLYFANNESIKAYFLETVVGVQIQFGAYFYRCLSLFISPSI